MIRLNSLRARMTASVTVAFAVWMLLLCLGFMMYAHYTTVRKVEGMLNSTAEAMRRDLAEGAHQDTRGQHAQSTDSTMLSGVIAEHRSDLISNHIAALLVDAHGHIVRQSQDRTPPWPSKREDNWKIRTISAGTSTVVLGYDWGQTEDEFRERAIMLLALSLCVVVAAGLGAWVVVGRTLSPIGRLAQQATASSVDTLHIQLAAPSQDVEIVELVGTLNEMLARLSETAASKGRFYAAASHELCTPLQALSGHLEVALSRHRSAEEYRAPLDEAHTQTERLIGLVRDLLVLNQLDTAMTPPECETVSIAEICDRVLHEYQSLQVQRCLHLRTVLEHEGEVQAPPTHVEMLIRNLLENAMKYAAPGGDVHLNLAEGPSQITVTIFNSCAPIDHWDPELLFEPFFRLDVSRNAKTGGNGIGLAICKAICLANGWQLVLHHDGTGVAATLHLPRQMALS